jgi:hypothetical protein
MPDWYQDALKVPLPNELPVGISVHEECSAASFEEIKSIAEGVLIRSRIKPLSIDAHKSSPKKYPLFLAITLDCFIDELFVFTTDISFGWVEPEPQVLFANNYGSYGVDDAENIKTMIKNDIELALAGYMKINLDL